MNPSLYLPAFALATACLITGCGKSQDSSPPPAAREGQQQVDAADTLYVGGEIVTVDDKQPGAEALAVKGGKIVAVGARADVEKAHKGANTKIVDLVGKALLPGFLDAHSHYISSLSVAKQVNLYAPPAGPGFSYCGRGASSAMARPVFASKRCGRAKRRPSRELSKSSRGR